MSQILKIDNIHKSFSDTYTGTNGDEKTDWSHVLKGINLSLNKGIVTALIGGNGSGKSTLFNIISGLLPASKGNVSYFNNGSTFDLNLLPSYKHASIGIGRLFQGSNIFPGLSVLDNMLVADNIRLGEYPWHVIFKSNSIKQHEKRREEEAHFILKELLGEENPLWKQKDDLAGILSIGEQRLLAFARLFMNKQIELFLLDEPSAGVNPLIRNIMTKMILKLKDQSKTVLFIEHNMDFTLETATYAYYLEEGKISLNGNAETVINSDLVQTNYLGLNNG